MQTGVLRVLRATAASWWRHKELRRTGQTALARQLERETVLHDLGYLKQAATLPDAHVICGEGGTFIDIRPVTDVIAFANLPGVTQDGSVDPEPWGPGGSALLTAYINMFDTVGARMLNDPRPRQSI